MDPVKLSLPQMVDLALNVPEVGAVNFNLLHSLLHVLIQQVDLLETKVEFKGNTGDRIQNLIQSTNVEEPTVRLTEYVVISGSQPKQVISKRDHFKKIVSDKDGKDELVVEREVRILDEKDEGVQTVAQHNGPETVVVIETADIQLPPSASQTKVHDLKKDIDKIKLDIRQLKDYPPNSELIQAARSSTPMVDTMQVISLTKRVEACEEAVEKLSSLVEDLIRNYLKGGEGITMEELTGRIIQLETRMLELDGLPGSFMTSLSEIRSILEESQANIEKRLDEYYDRLQVLEKIGQEQAKYFEKLLTDLKKEVQSSLEKINTELAEQKKSCNKELYRKMIWLENQFEKFTKAVSEQLVGQEQFQATLNTMMEQIEELQAQKADHDYLDDALATKADERMWQQTLLDVQQEVDSKLDKMELSPLRDFIHNKLKMLQDKLKALTALRSDAEAAGAKSKMLKNVQCISCDANVVMRKEHDTSIYPPPAPLPLSSGLAPYLTYELDQLRRQKKCAPQGKNLIHFESAVSRDDNGKKEHVCNRYCGGSHTVTTAQQRVARVGHFLEQWEQEDDGLLEGKVKGVDGQLYKSRDNKEFYQLQVKPETTRVHKGMVVTSDILSDRPSSKTSKPTTTEDQKTTLAAPPTKGF
ncbi:hypothetical protein FQR65_LT10556 [Abscondita terminalis]|nr:hypothetical protein FQR65_LT10556 [Abscondita terminalis]